MRFYASAPGSADMQLDSIFALRTDGSALAPVLSEEVHVAFWLDASGNPRSAAI
jgi:hypothetical protein